LPWRHSCEELLVKAILLSNVALYYKDEIMTVSLSAAAFFQRFHPKETKLAEVGACSKLYTFTPSTISTLFFGYPEDSVSLVSFQIASIAPATLVTWSHLLEALLPEDRLGCP